MSTFTPRFEESWRVTRRIYTALRALFPLSRSLAPCPRAMRPSPLTLAALASGKDGKARAEKKKRAPDLWTMLYVAKPMQTPAGHPHQQPPCSFLSKEVVEPQPALDTGEESDIDSMFSNDASDRKDLTQECSELATRLANANRTDTSICVLFASVTFYIKLAWPRTAFFLATFFSIYLTNVFCAKKRVGHACNAPGWSLASQF